MKKRDFDIEGEIRTDFLGRTAIITPARGLRPHDFKSGAPKKRQKPKDCFFCPNNESKTPCELDRTLEDGGHGWQNRCFPNKFPALCKSWERAYGSHEVIVETPKHSKTLSQLDAHQIEQYLLMIKKRLIANSNDKKIRYISVFKNEREDAGASLEHTHTQLVAMPFVPRYAKVQESACKNKCHFCAIESDKKYPKIASTKNFLLLCPYVPQYGYEMWLLPKKHIRSLSDMDSKLISELAGLLSSALKTQDSVLNYPPYNILYNFAPPSSKNFHMYISIIPRTSKWAGFEHQSGVIMNSASPKLVAKAYKSNLLK